MEKFIDLHTHSNASDGSMAPAEVVRHAKAAGLSAIALTDHDTTDGLAEAQEEAARAGLELVCGIELSADYETEMHILGYFIDPSSPALAAELAELKRFRAERNRAMLARLRELGFDLGDEETVRLSGASSVANLGRVPMARAMVAKGYAESIKACFEQYLRSGKAGYLARQRLSARDCIGLIRAAGGIAVLAHPIQLRLETDALDALLAELVGYGLGGLECHYTDHDEAHTAAYLRLADQHGLAVTGGSDFHAENKPHIPIGTVYGGRRVPYEILEALKERVQAW